MHHPKSPNHGVVTAPRILGRAAGLAGIQNAPRSDNPSVRLDQSAMSDALDVLLGVT